MCLFNTGVQSGCLLLNAFISFHSVQLFTSENFSVKSNLLVLSNHLVIFSYLLTTAHY